MMILLSTSWRPFQRTENAIIPFTWRHATVCGTAAMLTESGKTGMKRTAHFSVRICGPDVRPLPVSAKIGRSGTRGLDVTLLESVDV